MRQLASRRAFWAMGGALAALGVFFNTCRPVEYWGARRAFLAYHEAVVRLDAEAARGRMSEDLSRRFDRWLAWTAVLSDDMKMKILSAGLPRRPRFQAVAWNRDSALLTMTGETVGGQKVSGRVVMVRRDGDWRVHSQKWDVAGEVISL